MNDIFSKEYNDELDDIIGKILDENENKLDSDMNVYQNNNN